MSSYVGVAKRIASTFFPNVVPVPQLQPLDARKIFYASEEDAWAAFLTWEEAKAQEREEKTIKAARAARAATRPKYDIYDPSTWPPYLWPAKPVYDAYDPSTWPPYVWPSKPATVLCKKPCDAHVAALLAAPAVPKKGIEALKGKLGNLNFMIPGAAPPPKPEPAKERYWHPAPAGRPSLFGDSDEDEGDGDYGTDDDSLRSWDAF